MRRLATVDTITSLTPIPNSDFLEVAIIRHWQAVVEKGKFKVGEKIIYCEIDSFLPVKPEYEHLRSRCYKQYGDKEGFRLKSIKLRGCLSQGLVLKNTLSDELPVGTDVTEELGIELYSPPTKLHLSTDILGVFPTHLIKTEEERIQNLEILPEIYAEDDDYKISEKLDGSSMTILCEMDDEKITHFGVCSRNYELKRSPHNIFWAKAIELNVEEKIQKLIQDRPGFLRYDKTTLVIQGELIGPKLNGNHYKLKETDFYAFSVYIIWGDRPIKRLKFEDKLFYLNELDLKHVPILNIPYNVIKEYTHLSTPGRLATHEDYLKFADGPSKINPDVLREGIVVRDRNETTSFKAISNAFLVAEKS